MIKKPEVSEASFEIFQRECLLQDLEGQPRVAQAIRVMWGGLDLEQRFKDWIMGEEGLSLGFKPKQIKALLDLSMIHAGELEKAGLLSEPENPMQWNAPKWKVPKGF